MGMNHFEEVKATLDKADAQGMGLVVTPFAKFWLAFIQHDDAGMQNAENSANGFGKALVLLFKSESEYYEGKIKAGRQTAAQLIDFSKSSGLNEFAASVILVGPSFEVEMGDASGARQAIATALGMARDRDTQMSAAILMARTGDSTGADRILSGLAKQFPDDTMLNSAWIPVERATMEIRRNNPAKAIQLLESARQYEFGSGPFSCGYWPAYVRGEAYLKTHEGAQAAVEYQKILDHRGVEPTNPLYSLSSLGLARAYALQGDSAKARTEYQNFLAEWKDADPDVPVLKQAKAEYAKLQ
jgi:tetratricopeptide (TPR) repeat protein